MGAPLALGKGKGRSRFPSGMENQKGKCKDNSKCEYGDLSTAHDMKPSCFGRDDRFWVGDFAIAAGVGVIQWADRR